MNNRTVTGLAAALVVLGALALFAQYDPQPDAPGGGLLLPGLNENLDQITRMTITGAGAQTVATLERGDTGWSIAEKNGYPADVEKIRHTLVSLAEARIVEPKTAIPGFYDRLGVEGIENDNATGLAVALTGADTLVDVIVGDTEGISQAYVREVDEAQSFLIDRDPEAGSDATDWLDTELLAIDGSRVARVTVTHSDGEVVSVFKNEPEQSNFEVDAIPPDRELQYASIANVMGTVLANLALQDVEPLTETDIPVTVTEFVAFDGLAITAESLERGDEAWVAFRAAYRAPEEAGEVEEVEDIEEDSQPEDDSTEASPDASQDLGEEQDVAAEAAELDQRLSGWRYRIANYQFDQMTRRMSDLLRALPEE